MIKRNPNLSKLTPSYLFVEINKRKEAFCKDNPDAELISLGIGDTTEPLGEALVKSMMHAAVDQGVRETYQGYGPEAGMSSLREKISKTLYHSTIPASDIFVSDGAKCDLARLQTLFAHCKSIGVQDPSYPVYIDGSLIQGIEEIHLLPCTQSTNFFPDLSELPALDLLYICSPNNPTGVAYTKEQLEALVEFAKANQCLILFDAAYSCFITDPEIPKSIYEIEGAKEVAIEMQSFSKSAGFTGIRLGFTVVPSELKYSDGESIQDDFKRIISTLFNGASILSQKGGLGALSDQGLAETQALVEHYLENAALLKATFEELNFEVHGGVNAPYLWIRMPGLSSWEAFQLLLDEVQLITTPGSGFGEAGEGFIRVSAFCSKEQVETACARLKANSVIAKIGEESQVTS